MSELEGAGFTFIHIAVIIETILSSRSRFLQPNQFLELVLSGPSVDGVPTCDTSATVQTLFTDERIELLLAGFALQNTEKIFVRLADRMHEIPALKVTLCLNVHRVHGYRSVASEILLRFVDQFWTKHWPWDVLPNVYYDPRSLETETQSRASMHAKCVVADRRAALITSANFTQPAQTKNIEVGLVVRHSPTAERLATYFDGMISNGKLTMIEMR
jgi:phosphatidylserine/phosphatidylglycerophosphate/cardiolipin synthase-like enzyme